MLAQRSVVLKVLRYITSNRDQVKSLLRSEYRCRLGIPLDRRLHPATSALPAVINVNLTRRCNLKCLMCIQHRHSSDTPGWLEWYDPKRELSLSEWIHVMDQVKSFRPILYVTGGEPTLHPSFADFIKEAKKRRLPVNVATNGTLLSRHAEMLVEQGVEVVTVSLDGPPDIHDEVRGEKGLFERTAYGIEALLEARSRLRRPTPLLGLMSTISKTNIRFIPDMVQAALDLGVDYLEYRHTIFDSPDHVEKHNSVFSPEMARVRKVTMLPPSIPEGEYYECDFNAEDVALIEENLRTARRLARGRLRLASLPGLSSEILHPYYLNLDHPFPGKCNGLWKSLRIMPDGTVSPCLHVVAGNIARQSLDEIWNGSVMRNFREMIAHKLLPGCARCCHRDFS